MPNLDLKTTNKAIKDYYTGLAEFDKHGVTHEMAVRSAFQRLLEQCSKRVGWTFVGEYKFKRKDRRPVSIDGGIVDAFTIPQAFWEAKDSHDDLVKEVQNKFSIGYPKDNIIFQEPRRAILWQGGREICDLDITKADALVYVVQELFTYRDQTQLDWEQAVADFKPLIPDAARKVVELIEVERKESQSFIKAFNTFAEVCRTSVNPNLSDSAVEEMLVQHLLTERIFRKVFHNSDFTDRNIIAHEIERVIHSLTSRKFSKEEFLKPLDRFYVALERRAESLYDYSQQQTFLNTVYEKFFQGFAVKQADTHGIVYTPQPIVDFMVRSVEEILKKEFGKSLSDEGVHIIDPFVGTGNFITRIMREMKKTSLPQKYANELHCNEVMLLPYYVASMNIEHEYYERTGEYKPFEGICLVDTFDLAEDKQLSLMFTQENTDRVERLRKTKLFVIIGNPPYNASQVNENDNNKNRKYKTMDKRVADTYSRDSSATNKNALSDPYVKAIRWASDKILDNGEGVVAFVSNNGFIDNTAFDGMRKHLENDFNHIYLVDLKGNIRKDSMRDGIPLGEKHTVFGLSAMVGVAISIFVKHRNCQERKMLYAETDFRASRAEKFRVLESVGQIYGLDTTPLHPDKKHTWLTAELEDDFETLVPMGTRQSKAGLEKALFMTYSRGVATCRDAWAYNFSSKVLSDNVTSMIGTYNQQVMTWVALVDKQKVDDFVSKDDSKISWSEGLKKALEAGHTSAFNCSRIRESLYRPFVQSYLYMDRRLNERRYQMHLIFPESGTEGVNRLICLTGKGSEKPFSTLMTNKISDLNFFGPGSAPQGFPFYAYHEDGTNRRENITDWAVDQFSSALGSKVEKWQIFHYIYGLLHSPEYREKYQANLKRELPRIVLPKSADDFSAFVSAGERLADLHVNYESQKEYPLEKIEHPDKPLNWGVEKMKLTKDKTAIIYNDFLTLAGVPPEAFEYKLGNRSALEWIIDRYRIHTDKRSGIVNDPNRADEPEYIVRLIGKVIRVSLETVHIVRSLPSI
jgi:predicted helicase